jgi:hypothetical protein
MVAIRRKALILENIKYIEVFSKQITEKEKRNKMLSKVVQ